MYISELKINNYFLSQDKILTLVVYLSSAEGQSKTFPNMQQPNSI